MELRRRFTFISQIGNNLQQLLITYRCARITLTFDRLNFPSTTNYPYRGD